MTAQLGFSVDLSRCIGCHTCAIACKDWNDREFGPGWREVKTIEGGTYPATWVYNLSLACNHCENPACRRVCPAGAYTKRPEDGIVVHDPTRCLGCRYCTWACPYGAPKYDPAVKKVSKCNLCLPRLRDGQKPVCVEACPMRALDFGPIEELQKKAGVTNRVRHLADPGLTNPSVVFKPKRGSEAE